MLSLRPRTRYMQPGSLSQAPPFACSLPSLGQSLSLQGRRKRPLSSSRRRPSTTRFRGHLSHPHHGQHRQHRLQWRLPPQPRPEAWPLSLGLRRQSGSVSMPCTLDLGRQLRGHVSIAPRALKRRADSRNNRRPKLPPKSKPQLQRWLSPNGAAPQSGWHPWSGRGELQSARSASNSS